MIGASAAYLIANGFEALAVWALEDNAARAFYTALGGAVAEKRRLLIGGTEVIEQCYRWPSMAADLRTD